MYKSGTLSGHQLKFWLLAAVIVSMWFVWKVDFGEHSPLPPPPPPPPTNPEPQSQLGESGKEPPQQPSAFQTGKYHNDDAAESTPATLLNTKEYCERYRMKPFDAVEGSPKRKVYDLLLVNTELEMLEIRLGQMYPDVDYFVILESDRTFTDKPKPLHVQENWERFKPYHEKIIRRTMDLSGDFERTWDRERVSRSAMFNQVVPFLEGEQQAHEDDIILVSDVDEIPKPNIIRALRTCHVPQRVTLMAKNYYYSFQWTQRGEWAHPQATVYKGANNTIEPDALRGGAADLNLYEAAWHCSYCFSSIGEMIKKITSFSHTEMDRDEFKDPAKILHRVRNGIDAFDRGDNIFYRVEDNKDVPGFILKNRNRFGFLLDRDAPGGNFKDWADYGTEEAS